MHTNDTSRPHITHTTTMSATQENQGNSKKVQFMATNEDLDGDLNDQSEGLEGGQPEEKPDYYDPVYFDSDSYEEDSDDEKQDADEQDYDRRAGLAAKTDKGKSKSSDMSEITTGLQQASLQTLEESKKSKKQPTISNEELLYDPDEDDRDEEWLIKKIAGVSIIRCDLLSLFFFFFFVDYS